jgi:comEA protein
MSDGDRYLDTGERRLNVALWVALGLLIAAIIAGGAVFLARNMGGDGRVEIALPAATSSAVEVYLSGAVPNEGIYSFSQDVSLEEVLQQAGGAADGLDPVRVRLCVLEADESPFDQREESGSGKINVNTASLEELQTLYGIGPSRAQAIIDYRNEHGFFRTVDELINISGIGPKILDDIRDCVTVVD